MDGTRVNALFAFIDRAASRQEKALEALIDSGKADGVCVCFADSLRAHNCDQGTRSFASRHNLDTDRHYTAGELLQIANGDAQYVRAAILAAMRRERTEMSRGYSVVAEHRA